jgi:hypothetical protein
MNNKADLVKGYAGANPFRDHQARTFSNSKLVTEFFPTSKFWSLFNDQHEVLIGRRGSGKTILLRMMRYSLLKRISHPDAEAIVKSQLFFGITVSTHLEFVGNLLHQEIPEQHRLLHFQFGFNCMLSRSLLNELDSVVNEQESFVDRGRLSGQLTAAIAQIWFPEENLEKFRYLDDIDRSIEKIYQASTVIAGEIDSPPVFKNSVCSPIQAVSSSISKILGYSEEPTWLIGIDEAEFLPLQFQRCINSLFRADSRKIVIKMATLPYKHLTKETLVPGVYAESNGNDFSYRTLDMDPSDEDFINVTNNLCATRLGKAIGSKFSKNDTLEDFVGRVGEDGWVDYYKNDLNNKNCKYEDIFRGIVSQFSPEKQLTIPRQNNRRKQTYDKYAPIYFFREMFKKSTLGNYTPGWFAGGSTIRKIAQGNPRMFIKIMNELFDGAKTGPLSHKAQHSIIYKFVDNEFKILRSTLSEGPYLYDVLSEIATELKRLTHEGTLSFHGNNFQLRKIQIESNPNLVKALEFGVAYLHVDVDLDSFNNKITADTKFTLANYISAYFWIPMRKGAYPKIKLNPVQMTLY